MTKPNAVLMALKDRIASHQPLDPMVGVIADFALVVARGNSSELRYLEAAADALIPSDLRPPVLVLTGPNREAYAAGALWAVTEMINAVLNAQEKNL